MNILFPQRPCCRRIHKQEAAVPGTTSRSFHVIRFWMGFINSHLIVDIRHRCDDGGEARKKIIRQDWGLIFTIRGNSLL